jgi:hypothetical protein
MKKRFKTNRTKRTKAGICASMGLWKAGPELKKDRKQNHDTNVKADPMPIYRNGKAV